MAGSGWAWASRRGPRRPLRQLGLSASVRVEAGVLVVEAEGDGVATVTVTATDAHGQMGTLAFTVRATLPMRGGLRGWRLILVEGVPDA